MASSDQRGAATARGDASPQGAASADVGEANDSSWKETLDWLDQLLNIDSRSSNAAVCDTADRFPTQSTSHRPHVTPEYYHSHGILFQLECGEPHSASRFVCNPSRSPVVQSTSSALQTSTATVPVAGTTKPRRTARATSRRQHSGDKPKCLSTIDRQKREIRVLREEATELEELIVHLKSVWQQSDSDAVGGEHTALYEPQWKQVAMLEMGRLQASLDENKELRECVAQQRHLSKGLRRILAKRVAQIAIINKALKDDRDWRPRGTSPDDQQAFSQLLVRTNAMLAQLGDVMRVLAIKIPAAQDSFRIWEVKRAAVFGESPLVSLEMVSHEEVPFESKTVYRALRALAGERHAQMENYRAESAGLNSDTCLRMMHLRFSNDHWSSANRLRSVTRCYVDGAHTVIMTTTYIDSVSSDTGEPSNETFMLREQKWTILSHQEGSSQTAPVTKIQGFSVITPEFVHSSLANMWRKEIVETVVIPLWESGAAANQQMLENALLEQAAVA